MSRVSDPSIPEEEEREKKEEELKLIDVSVSFLDCRKINVAMLASC